MTMLQVIGNNLKTNGRIVLNDVARLKRHARVRAKISGTAERPRLCVYRSNANISAQIIDDTKGITLVSASEKKQPAADTHESASFVRQ